MMDRVEQQRVDIPERGCAYTNFECLKEAETEA
jgi:hypothetical protein